MITALAGGVGAAKLIAGLVKVILPEDLTVIVNTGDDILLHSLYISPDIDIITYTLANLIDENKGWGIRDDTFNCLSMLRNYSCEIWFNLGDRDLATHIFRTKKMKEGSTLTEVTKMICSFLNIQTKILPMTNSRVETIILTKKGKISFQRYLVERKAQDKVLGVEFKGIESAKPAPGVLEALSNSKKIIICPSNPIVSIGTILAVTGVKRRLMKGKAPIVAISPIIEGLPIKGPADKLMKGLNIEVSAYSVAKLYREFIDTMIIDDKDEIDGGRIEEMNIKTLKIDTIMNTQEDRVRVAKAVLRA
jgi:LPPG:FO 2-phospho-L-lactate transferase